MRHQRVKLEQNEQEPVFRHKSEYFDRDLLRIVQKTVHLEGFWKICMKNDLKIVKFEWKGRHDHWSQFSGLPS